ncbi:hypothetical protein L2E82_01347 [Cichorium intybus]|uniref:Uncharacterized protein n=1 Tax=Cichorium intybus TaxID=13427 RepID=A0ACB9GZX2_CICIN|nr:hypothetical protein L2E82_01347 [Cichorium intybus]
MQRRTVTIKWDQLDDFIDEDDEFFESTNRLSAVVPLDMPLSQFDDDYNGQGFNDSLVSFSNNLASNSIKENQNVMFATAAPGGQYDMWMVAPGSITDRRRRLLEGMGLNSNKDFRLATNKYNKAYTKKLVSTEPVFTSLDTKIANEKPNADSVVKESTQHSEESKRVGQKQLEPQPSAQTQSKHHLQQHPQPQPDREQQPGSHAQVQVQDQVHVQSHVEVQDKAQVQTETHVKAQAFSLPVLLIRSRSDSDIDTSSFNTKRRKEEMIGSISKQRLTRTSSELVTPSVGLSCQYANIVKMSTPEQTKRCSAANGKNKDNANNATAKAQVDSFFLIKNLDTGKEFVVKESNEEGWNKVSDLQTGKQLTMDEFEKTVGHSPMVKELMRRTSRKKNGNATGKLLSSNSLISKSFRCSKKKGAAILKTIKSSVKGSKVEKEKDDSVAAKTTTTTNNTSSSSSKTSGEQKTSGQLKTSGEQKTGGEQQKTSVEQKTSGEPQKTSGEPQKTSGEQKTGGGQQKTSGELKTEGGPKKTSGEQKASTEKNSNSEWVKAKAHGKPIKEFSALHLCQEIQAHDGSIWTMRFSLDGRYLATGGEDKVIHIWEVQECDVMSILRPEDDMGSGTPDNRPPLPDNSATSSDKKKKSKNSKKKSGVPDYAKVPETMFGLSDIPIYTFEGHEDDVLDLSWSRSQLLLSSSMDKTVRLWDMATNKCLKKFTHSDYVTCIHFNPTDDDYFISGSLDTKVRIWSIPKRKVVDWSDLHDMITSVCYYPDGQGAIVGLHRGDCKPYCTAGCKLEQKDQIELHTKAKADPKKITGFQFSPSNPSEMLVTSADSRIRILDGSHVVTKLIGYKNTTSQFLAQYSADGKYIICASEDSQVYIWKHEKPKSSGGAKPKYVTTTSYEHFPCTEVTVVVPWSKRSGQDPVTAEDNVQAKKSSQLPPVPKNSTEKSTNSTIDDSVQPSRTDSSIGTSDPGDASSRSDGGNNNNTNVQSTAWGLVIVAAGVGGEIKVYQNIGLPVKVGSNLF